MSLRSSDPSVASLRDLLDRYGIAAGKWPLPLPTVGSGAPALTIDPFAGFGQGAAPQAGIGSTPGMRLASAPMTPGMRLAEAGAASVPGFRVESGAGYGTSLPLAKSTGKQQPNSDSEVQLAQLECQNTVRGCESGGNYGTSGMYLIRGRVFCTQCAKRELGIQYEPGPEQLKTLRSYLIGGK